jgi:pimeloyl-ACP methyl ester carboxylesterase
MTISNIQELHDFAETALATYANLSTNQNLITDLQQPATGATFTSDQAAQFAARYALLAVQPNTDWNGFSAAVFLDRVTGEKIFAIRGTEFDRGLGQIGTDLVLADVLGIGVAGYANFQAVEMYRYWKKLTTVGGRPVSYSATEMQALFGLYLGLPGQAVPLNFDAFKAQFASDVGIDSGVQGQPIIGVGEKIDVTGHSLGGHLALLFSRLFPGHVDEVVALNAPTFFYPGDAYLSSIGFINTLNSHITRIEADGDGVSELGNIEPGSVIRIAQENKPGLLAAISVNHSSVNGVDALALMAVIARLDIASASDATGAANLIRAGSNSPERSYENILDALRRQLLGIDVMPTPTSSGASDASRADLYANLKALTNSQAFKALAGNVKVQLAGSDLASQAKTDFSAFLTLHTLSPIYLKTDAAGQAILKQANESLAQQWEADQSLTQEQRAAGLGNFSNAYLLDRQAMLEGLIAINKVDASYDTALQGKLLANYTYTDVASSQIIRLKGTASNANAQQPQQVVFGDDDQDDSLSGSDAIAAGVGDRLYGAGGDDIIDAKSGNDYLEGDAGDDTLIGGAGNDVLLGGAGNDTYQFTGTFDHDILTDADGEGLLQLNGNTLAGGKANGVANNWFSQLDSGQLVFYQVVDSTRSSTDKQLVITKQGDANDSITINNFNLNQALGSNGYLGIKLDPSPKIVVKPSVGANFWNDIAADAQSLDGKGSTLSASGTFTLYLNEAAKAGQNIVLKLAGLVQEGIKAVLGDDVVDADGATITLAEGQTQFSFALIRTGSSDAHALVRRCRQRFAARRRGRPRGRQVRRRCALPQDACAASTEARWISTTSSSIEVSPPPHQRLGNDGSRGRRGMKV